MFIEENGASRNRVWIVFQRIWAVPCLFRCFLQFRVDGRIVFRRCGSGKLVGIPALSKHHRHGKKRSANGERRGNGFHLWPPNSRLTIEPNPVISRVTPQRSRNWWLLSFKPKPGEIRSAQPDGKFQPRTGARECDVSGRPKLRRPPRPPYVSTPPLKFCGHSVQRRAA